MHARSFQRRRTCPCPFQKPVTAAQRLRWKWRVPPTLADIAEAMGRKTDAAILDMLKPIHERSVLELT